MAACIQQNIRKELTRKPELISKLDGHTSDVNCAILLSLEDGIITANDDRSLRVWLKRDSGQYWPTVCQYLPSPVTCIEHSTETHRLFLGCDNGTVVESLLAEDANSIQHKRDILAHTGRVTGLKFAVQTEWVLSCSRDKHFTWHCSETGRRCGGFILDSPATALQFDVGSKFAFVGDSMGAVTILRLASSKCDVIHSLKGHSETVRSLAWDPIGSRLFSGSSDMAVIAWDIGGGKGTAFELQGHEAAVSCVVWCACTEQMISAGDDSRLVMWNMDVRRVETPAWKENDFCNLCKSPFFWNIKSMWENKTVGVRQHHCRLCGEPVCDKCSPHTSTYPVMGFEKSVRICNTCHESTKNEDKAPLAAMFDAKHQVLFMHLDETNKKMLTVGKDRIVKLWDMGTLIS